MLAKPLPRVNTFFCAGFLSLIFSGALLYDNRVLGKWAEFAHFFFLGPNCGPGTVKTGMGMHKGEVMAKLDALGRTVAEGAGMEFVHLDLERQRGGWFLRLFIDKPGGVTLDDCAAISRQFGAELDAQALMDTAYTLEVSSPGLNRPLRSESDFRRFVGKLVAITTLESIQGQKHFVGRLVSFDSGIATVVDKGQNTHPIPYREVSKARLEVEL